MHAKHAQCGLFTVGAIVFASLSTIQTVRAQAFYPQAQAAPNHPTLSPYLDLLRDDNSVLSPYHSFVLPRRTVQQQQARQSMAIGQLQATVAPLQDSRLRPLEDYSRLSTGGGGTYHNYSHYYPSRAGNSGGRSSISLTQTRRSNPTRANLSMSAAIPANGNQRR